MPLVSVVLPVYNAENFVDKAVGSILEQTLSDLELIIVANGSNRATLDEIQRFADNRIRIVHLEKPDIVDALNVGLRKAEGKYIARMDADDVANPERLEKQVNFLETYRDYDVVSCGVAYEGDAKSNQGYFLHVQWLNQLKTFPLMFDNRFVDSPVAHPTIMARKELFARLGHYKNGSFPEDYELILRWLDGGIRIGKVEEALLRWYDHPGRLSRLHPRYSTDAFCRTKAEYFARWFRRNFPGRNEVLVWGNGKSVRNKCRFLQDYGISIEGYIDVKPARRENSTPVYHYSGFPSDKFVLSYVGDRKGRAEIFQFLSEQGKVQGRDFYMMS